MWIWPRFGKGGFGADVLALRLDEAGTWTDLLQKLLLVRNKHCTSRRPPKRGRRQNGGQE